jgi:hypothetical protein
VGVQLDNGKPAHLLDADIWDTVMNVNVKSHFLMAKHCLPGMLKHKSGCIINIGSVQGRQSQVRFRACVGNQLPWGRRRGCAHIWRRVTLFSHDARSLAPRTGRYPGVRRVQRRGCVADTAAGHGLLVQRHPRRVRVARHHPDAAGGGAHEAGEQQRNGRASGRVEEGRMGRSEGVRHANGGAGDGNMFALVLSMMTALGHCACARLGCCVPLPGVFVVPQQNYKKYARVGGWAGG